MNKVSYSLSFKTSSRAILFTIALVFTAVFSQAQDQAQSQPLSNQFNELKDNSESYNEYKVIKTYSLNQFWKAVEDSLSGYRNQIGLANKEISGLQAQIDQLNGELSDLKGKLEQSEARNDQIAFLGININKSLYNVIVWCIIGGLAALAIIMFISFKNNFKVTKKARKDFDDLILEFEEYRRISREKQMKMGRELQTERNTTEDLRDKLQSMKAHSK